MRRRFGVYIEVNPVLLTAAGFYCFGWRGWIDKALTDGGQERGTREIYWGRADTSLDRRGESASYTLSDTLTGSGLKWRKFGGKVCRAGLWIYWEFTLDCSQGC